MRLTAGLLALFLATALILAGCLQVPDEDSDTTDGDDDSDFNGDPQNETDLPRDPGDGNGDGTGGRPGGNETQEEDEDKECHEYEPPKAVPPEEHEVGSEDEIRCAGQYTITNEGSGETWAVPVWEVGDWWRYKIEVTYGAETQCQEEEITVIDDSKTSSGVPIYTMEIQRYDCEGEEQGGPREENRTQDSLMRLQDDGYVDHQAIFPFQDSKSWVYMMSGNGNMVDMGPIEYDDSHPTSTTTTVEAWHVEWELGENGEVEFEQTWAPDVKNILEEEMVTSAGGVTVTMTKDLIDSNYELDEDSLLPGTLP